MMFRVPTILLLILLATASTARGEGVAIPGRIVVKLDHDIHTPESARGTLATVAVRYGIGSIESYIDRRLLGRATGGRTLRKGSVDASLRALARIVVVDYMSADPPAEVARKVSSLPGVEYAEPMYERRLYVTPNDPGLAQQWYLRQVKATEGWDSTRADSTMLIAIVDTGVDYLHPDLADAIWRNPGETGPDDDGEDRSTNGVDDDGNGLVDDWIGYDFAGRTGATPDNNPTPGHWHGTHVAGIAAASGNNGIGIAGTAWGARVMALKIADDRANGEPSLVRGMDAILYAATMGARVINCSWGGPGRSQAEQETIVAVLNLGSLVVAAAGNSGDSSIVYPASYEGVLSVASVMGSDERSIFSNFNTVVGIAAPGEEVYSTLPRAVSANGYGPASGTSMSAPIVSGAAALVATRYPTLSPQEIAAVLRANADDIDGRNPNYYLRLGSGRLNVLRALEIGPDATFATIDGFTVIDASGDRIVDPGEATEVRIDVENVLRPTSDLRVVLSSPADVEWISPEERFGSMGRGERRSSVSGSLRLVAPKTSALDVRLPVFVTLYDGDRRIGAQRVDIVVNPNFATTNNERVAATFTGHGRIGFDDFPRNSLGDGFRYRGSENLLAEGGLLIGTSPSRLADVVRNGELGYPSQALRATKAYRVRFSDSLRAYVGETRFDDSSLLPQQKNGLDISLRTIEYGDDLAGNQVLLLYTIRNTSAARFEDLYCALYLDWDLGPLGVDNEVQFDPRNRMGTTHNVEGNGLPVVGSMLLSDQPMNFYALDNNAYPLSNGFFQVEKWEVMTSGVARETSSVTDCSLVIGAGPISLEAGADTVVAFSLMAGASMADLERSATAARDLFTDLGGRPGKPIALPRELKLLDATPNPFTDHVEVTLWMPSAGPAIVDVYNSIGERVATLADGVYTRGIYTFRFEPGVGGDEAYFIRLYTLGQTRLQKVVRFKAR